MRGLPTMLYVVYATENARDGVAESMDEVRE